MGVFAGSRFASELEDQIHNKRASLAIPFFFAQPSAVVASLELPPAAGDLADEINVLFTKTTNKLANAKWAQVNRREYLELVHLRKKQCASYTKVNINEDIAFLEIPEEGVPTALLATEQEVEGMDKAPVQLSGPASRAPEQHPQTEADGNSDTDSDLSLIHI